jgi:hypothetical protein
MKYMLLICVDPDVQSTSSGPTIDEWVAEVEGKRLDGSAFHSPKDATTVRTRGDEVLLSDGPFAETREQIGGYCLIECADLDEAIDIASKHPAAGYGTIEIRPLWQV